MAYQNFIRYALLKDLFLSLFFLIFIPLIYFGAQLHKEPNRGCVLAALTVFWGGWALFGLYTNYHRLQDYVAYLRYGDAYLQVCFSSLFLLDLYPLYSFGPQQGRRATKVKQQQKRSGIGAVVETGTQVLQNFAKHGLDFGQYTFDGAAIAGAAIGGVVSGAIMSIG